MTKQTITVVGGTGAQGGGVVDALLASGQYAVRVVSRNPASKSADTLEKRGVRVVKGDLLEPSSLRAAFEGAHGVFLVTNFWDPTQMPKETEIGNAAVKEARAAGVQHFIWSTLPDAEKLTGGRLKLPHFTGKARVDAAVEAAKFPRHTFVQAPFYFQNLLGMLAPQPLPNGGRGWAVPMNPAARVMHAGDVNDVGRVVAAAFAGGDKLRNGSYLAVCGGMYSWNDFVSTLNAQGHDVQVQTVPADAYDTFFPGAPEVRETFQYFAADALCYCLGEVQELSATVTMRRKSFTIAETGESRAMNADDQVCVAGLLEGGAGLSIHYRGGRSRGTNMLWEINGTEGDLQVTADGGQAQIFEMTVRGGNGAQSALEVLPVPQQYRLSPLHGPSTNVAQAYARFARDYREGTHLCPTFDDAVTRHRMLDAIETAAATGQRQTPG